MDDRLTTVLLVAVRSVDALLVPGGLKKYQKEHGQKNRKWRVIVGLLAELETALRLFGSLKDLRLSEEEKELLKAARDAKDRMRGVFAQMPGDMNSFPYIQAGDRHFDFDDPRITANYRKAFATLIKRGWVEHQGGILFLLTADGWNASDKLD